jgi:hypothetical protein
VRTGCFACVFAASSSTTTHYHQTQRVQWLLKRDDDGPGQVEHSRHLRFVGHDLSVGRGPRGRRRVEASGATASATDSKRSSRSWSLPVRLWSSSRPGGDAENAFWSTDGSRDSTSSHHRARGQSMNDRIIHRRQPARSTVGVGRAFLGGCRGRLRCKLFRVLDARELERLRGTATPQPIWTLPAGDLHRVIVIFTTGLSCAFQDNNGLLRPSS